MFTSAAVSDAAACTEDSPAVKISKVAKYSNETEILHEASKYSMIRNRMYTNLVAVNYIVKKNIKGVIIECGVAEGGSIASMAHMAMALGEVRPIHLYDTSFNGLPLPSILLRRLNGTGKSTSQHHMLQMCLINSIFPNLLFIIILEKSRRIRPFMRFHVKLQF
jgi:hypothetical protein